MICNEDENDISKIIKSLEDPGVLINGVTATVKHKLKSKRVNFLELFSTFYHFISTRVISLLVKGISGRWGRRPER